MDKRLHSLDFLRGACIIWMLFQHITLWLANANAFPLLDLIVNIFDGFGSGAFLFVSGLGITLSHRKKYQKTFSKQDNIYKKLRLKYFLKAILLLVLSFGFNLFIYFVVSGQDPTVIWIWFILQTLPISMILAWPLLNRNKYYKILAALSSLILYQILISFLYPFKAEYNHPLFIIQFILFNGDHLSPILGFFPFFIIGAFFGDIIHEHYNNPIINNPNLTFFKKRIIPLFLIGTSLILAGIFLIPPGIISMGDKSFLFSFRSISWLTYSLGMLINAYTLMLTIEKSQFLKINEKYRFVYYFSYYSLSIFLLHYIFDIFFIPALDLWLVFIFWSMIVLGVGLVTKGIHGLIGNHFSLKHQLGVAANLIANLIYKEEIVQPPLKLETMPILTSTETQKKVI
ncbi:MAG: DUF1624 domain-containing protein [Promethearchaeota archaeon]|nr:MAG: DUF1624 domain-containing protein [Candidatus Lokiarchaeota archaeon]